MRESAGVVAIGIAVQDANFADVDRATGRRITMDELLRFATASLDVRYLFWGTEEPYFTQQILPLLRAGSPAHQ
jgi:hypothetical protein